MKQACIECIYTKLPYQAVSFKEKDFVFMEGDELNHSFLIEEGLVKISRMSVNGEEKIFDIFGPGEFIALVSLLKNDSHYVASAECLTDVRIKSYLKNDVFEAYRSSNEFKDICLSCAMNRTNLFQSHLFQSANTDIEERIMLVLKYLSRKFGTIEKRMCYLELPFSKTTLASIIGIRRETLSRKLSSMQKNGTIDIDKNKYKFER